MLKTMGDGPPTVLLFGDTRRVGHHGSTLVVETIFEQLRARDVKTISSHTDSGWSRNLTTLKQRGIDAVIINGEGAFHRHGTHAGQNAAIARAVHQAGLPCFVMNSVFQECSPDVVDSLRHVTRMFCRETESLSRAKAVGIPAALCPDLVFAKLSASRIAPTDAGRVVVTDSTLKRRNRSLHAFARRHGFDFLPLRGKPVVAGRADRVGLIRLIKYHLRQRLGRLAPGYFEADRYGRAHADLDAFLTALLHDTRIVMTGRFHGVCFCLKAGVPFLALASNTHKVESLLADVGLSGRLLRHEELDTIDTSALLARAQWSDAEEQLRQRYLARAEIEIQTCFDEIASCVKANH